ncbi:MAG: S8/S53 family peptidase [Elusimicrobia bacterium]|nr:S8/S53 family peptidase [Elusimicrobiota bacterium]
MKKLLIFLSVLFIISALKAQQLVSDEQPDFANFRAWGGRCKVDLSLDMWKVDLRSCDLSKRDLSGWDKKSVLRYLSFDDETVWPRGGQMPRWLDPQEIMDLGRTPGLNITVLHANGITGYGVGIAIIDQGLTPHAEYQDNLVLYKNFDRNQEGSMHGAAVASIAVGQTVGVAPEADLFYISTRFENAANGRFNAGPIADAIQEIININKTLPKGQKIAVISISRGFSDMDNEREKFLSAVRDAKNAGIAVFTTDDVFTLSRAGYYADPDEISSYTQTAYWGDARKFARIYAEQISVPTDYRVLASPTGFEDYVAYSDGGLSWAVPYIAGLYALAAQVDSSVTKDTFMSTARKTAVTINLKQNGAPVKINYFVNPVNLINYFVKMQGGSARI